MVDRRALAAQAVRAFSSFDAEPGQKFDQVYEVYSNRFQRGDLDSDEGAQRFDPKLIPEAYLTDPQPGHAFVYVCTIQRIARNLGYLLLDHEDEGDDAGRLDIPVHAFDVVIADECHRGYTSAEQSAWRSTLEHFDGIKIGLTATPAKHTMAYFERKAFLYGYRRAVEEGYLVDYDAVAIKSNVRLQGVFLKEGEQVDRVDPESGQRQLDLLEDERQFQPTEVETKITAPDSDRKIVEEIKKHADEHERQHGRQPKILIFAVNDLPHTSLPKKVDKDPNAIFTREELERLISDARILEDRRVLYGLKRLAGLRHGEAARLCWRHYDSSLEPLGALDLERTKTQVPRRVPVHPMLARLLAEWKLAGWERTYGRAPAPDDLIVPTRNMTERPSPDAQHALLLDLPRRGHDLRRTLITLAQVDGARRDLSRRSPTAPEATSSTYTRRSPGRRSARRCRS